MTSENKKSDHTLAALIHLSTFSKYIIPLGNFIFPLILWTTGKKERLIDHHGKQALNFQLSIFFYMVLIISSAVASGLIIGATMEFTHFSQSFHFHDLFDLPNSFSLLVLLTIAGILLLGLFILELICVITATIKASEGYFYNYPLTINFIRSINQSKNEQSNNAQNEIL